MSAPDASAIGRAGAGHEGPHERDVLVVAGGPLGFAVAGELARDPCVRSVLCVRDRSAAPPEVVPDVEHAVIDLARSREVRDLLFSERLQRLSVIVFVPGRRPLAATSLWLAAAEQHPQLARFVYVSSAFVYRLDSDEPVLIDENHPLEFDSGLPPWLHERVEADLVACARIGVSRLSVIVLRCAEVLARGTGGQLHDYLSSRVCLRALGYDPMVNVLSQADAARAVRLAALSGVRGVFNIPGKDTLPLSELIAKAGRLQLAVPGPALTPLYALRARTTRFRFRYEAGARLFHFGVILDGTRAERALGYKPEHPVPFAALF